MIVPTLVIKPIVTAVAIQRYADDIGEPESVKGQIESHIAMLLSKWELLPWLLDMVAYQTQFGIPTEHHYGLAHAIIASESYDHCIDFDSLESLIPDLSLNSKSWTEVIEYLLGNADALDTMEQIIPIYKAYALHLGYNIN